VVHNPLTLKTIIPHIHKTHLKTFPNPFPQHIPATSKFVHIFFCTESLSVSPLWCGDLKFTLSKMEKQLLQQHARDLFLHTKLTRLQIAETLNIDRKTLYNWIKEGNWLQQRYLDLQGPNKLAVQYYRQLDAINTAIASRPDRPYPTKEETDIIRKLNATIQGYKKQQYVSDTQQVFKAVIQRIKDEDADTRLAAKVSNYFDKHIRAITVHAELGDDINFQKEDLAFETEYKKICAAEEKPNGENGEIQIVAPEATKPATDKVLELGNTTISVPQKQKNTTEENEEKNKTICSPKGVVERYNEFMNGQEYRHWLLEKPFRPTG